MTYKLIKRGLLYKKYKEFATGYRELTYLSGFGSVPTGIRSTNHTSFEFTFGFSALSSWSYCLGNNSSSPNWVILGYEDTSRNRITLHYRNAVYNSNVIPQTNEMYHVYGDFSANNKRLYVDGVEQIRITDRNTTDFGSDMNIWDAGGIIMAGPLKFFDSSNTIADIAPCERISDGALGFYDKIAGTFTATTGTKGDYIIEPGTPEDYDFTEDRYWLINKGGTNYKVIDD